MIPPYSTAILFFKKDRNLWITHGEMFIRINSYVLLDLFVIYVI